MAEPCGQVEPLLSAHVDEELDAATEAAVVDHVRVCPGCSAEVEELRRVRSLLRSLPVRRLPEDVPVPAGGPAHRQRVHGPAAARGDASRLVQVGAGLAVVVGLLTGAAFSLGGQPDPDTPVVVVPMDVYVADHFVHTVNRAVPVLLDLQR